MGVKLSPQARRAAQRVYLATLRRTGLKLTAAKKAGVHPSTPFEWAARDERFAEKVAEAQAIGHGTRLARLEAEVHRRARAGTADGASALLLMFETKRHEPAYRDNARLDVYAQGPVSIIMMRDDSPSPALAAEQGGMPALAAGAPPPTGAKS